MARPRNEIFKKAFLNLAIEETEYFAALPSAPFAPSAQFELKMGKLIKAQSHWSWAFIKNTKRKVASVLLAAVLLFTLSLGISAVREAVFTFFSDIHERFSSFYTQKPNSSKNGLTTVEKQYTLAWLEENCTQKEQLNFGVSVTTVWLYGEDEIRFEQSVSSGASLTLDNESEMYSKFVMGDTEYYYVLKNNAYCFLWNNGEYSFMLTLPGDMQLETCQDILSGFTEAK